MKVEVPVEDFTVDDDIQLDPRQVDEIFARSLNKGARSYLDRLERISTHEVDLDGDEISSLAIGFEGMRKFIAQKKNGYQSIKVVDFQDFGISSSFISKIRYLVHRLDTASPRQSITRLSMNSRRASVMTTSSVQDDCDDDYGDDFEDDEDDRSSYGSDRKSSKRESRSAKEVDDELMDIIDEEEEEEDERSTAAVAPAPPPVFVPVIRRAPESPTKYNRPNAGSSGSFYMRPHSGSTDNGHSSSVTITTAPINPISAAAMRFESIKPKVDPKYETFTTPKVDTRIHKEALTASQRSDCTSTTSSVSMRTSTAGLRRRVKNSTWINEGNWKLGEKIGTGSFGEVFKAMNDKGKLFAVKRLNMVGKPHEVQDLTREIELMKDLEHPNIVGYIGACVNEESGLVFIFQEWAPGGSVAHLLKHFGPFEIGTVCNYTRQILRGLCYLHDNGIIHRDIKGGNVLVDTGTVKLADFGASTKMAFGETQSTSTIKGTPYFMAPETLSQSKYGRKGDIWAVGCTVIQMLTGEPPWKEKNLNGLVQLHMMLASWNGPPDYDREVPPELKDCLELCFAKDAEKRPTAVDLLECAFLAGGDDLDETSNLGDQLGFAEPNSDRLGDSGVVLMQQISRAVSRASFCNDNGPGGVGSIIGNGHALKPQGGGWRPQAVQEDDSTMGGIDRQIMMRERMKAKQREDKDSERHHQHQPHYQLNIPSNRIGGGGGGGAGGYSPYAYDAGGKDADAGGRDDAKRLSPKDIADLVSQSSSQSANNPFAKGASPFSANKKGVASDPSSRNSPNPMTPVRGIRHIPLSNPLLSGGSNKSYPAAKQKLVHAFSEVNSSGNASDDMPDKEKERCRERDREKEREREREKERERDGSSSGGGGSFRSRVPFNDRSPVAARNPFHSIVEETKSTAGTSSSRSLPASPVFFPSSPSVLSSPAAASQRIPGFDKERSADSSDGICHSNGAGGREGVGVGGGMYSKYSGLFGSGSSHDITNGELTALKRKTHIGSNNSGNMAYNGSDVGSGLDCDGDYEGDDRRGAREVDRDRDRDRERGRHPHADRRSHDILLSGRGHEMGHGHGQVHGLGPGHAFNRNFSAAADDEDGEEPELDIIRPSQGPPKCSNHAQMLHIPTLDRGRAGGGSFNSGSNSNGKPLFLKNSMDVITASSSGNGSAKTRLVQSASQSRIRSSSSVIEPSSSTRRPSTSSTSKSPTPRSGSHSARHPTGKEDEENEGYGYRYDTSALSRKNSSQSNSQSGSLSPVPHSQSSSSATPVRSASHKGPSRTVMQHCSSERNIRSKSRDPSRGAPSPSTSSSSSKRDIVRIGPNQSEDGEDEGHGRDWQCLKCGDRNVNKVHCNSCSTMRNAYSYAPGQLQQRGQPR